MHHATAALCRSRPHRIQASILIRLTTARDEEGFDVKEGRRVGLAVSQNLGVMCGSEQQGGAKRRPHREDIGLFS
jgi:hypothetical protein